MTERLAQLLAREADELDVPPAPAAEVLARGRSLRRRRSGTSALAAVAVVAVVSGVALAASGGGGSEAVPPSDRAPEAPAADGVGVAFSIGNQVFLRGGEVRARVDDTSVKSLYYTSAGLVVRHGDNPWSDGGGPQRFSLVTGDGTVTPLSLETEETVHASDPTEPYLAYAEDAGDGLEVVVLDVRTDEEVARVAVPQHRNDFAPVALDGDTVYLGDGQRTFEVDWRTGEVAVSDVVRGYPDVAGGRAAVDVGGRAEVVDVATGETVLTLPASDPDAYSFGVLSPDGAHLLVTTGDPTERETTSVVHDLGTGGEVALPADDPGGQGWGWSADDELFRVTTAGEVVVCDPSGGGCDTTQPELPVLPTGQSGNGDTTHYLVLGGRLYES